MRGTELCLRYYAPGGPLCTKAVLEHMAAGLHTNGGTTPDASSFGIGAGIWWVLSSVIALAFGGYASAWLAGIEEKWDGVLHGLVTWGLATLLTISC